jgi:WhiB family transcriptional regulator, redox-sensing transcriptional regulator
VRDGLDSLVEALGLSDNHAWMARAACRGTNPDLFFPARGESTVEAKSICGGCAVRVQCAALAVTNHERFGIWGGLSERERKVGRARRTKVAA